MDLITSLDECKDFGCIFGLVKKSVEIITNKRRVGLMLALQDLPPHIGAYYPVGSNFIIMNKSLLEKVTLSQDKRTINSYIFYVLLHEYLHSLGYLNENIVRQLSYEICKRILGEDHTSTRIAKHGIGSFLSGFDISSQSRPNQLELEIIDNFDTENISYIG